MGGALTGAVWTTKKLVNMDYDIREVHRENMELRSDIRRYLRLFQALNPSVNVPEWE